MSLREIRLSTTPTPEAIGDLRLGDIVYLDGLMYTAREGVYMRALEDKANIPMELPSQSAANFHCSPAARINPDGSFDMGAVTATASFRFAKWLPEWMAKTGAKLDKLARMYGGVANNQGAVAEEFYFNSLKHNPVLRGIHFDSVYKNLTNNSHGIEDEYDILLLNRRDVFIIEVKYKARPDDVTTLIQKKAANFRPLFPAYQDHTLHLGLTSFHMDDEVKRSALSQGVTLLQRKGDFIETTPETPFH